MEKTLLRTIACAAALLVSASSAEPHRFTVALNAGGTAAENVPVALRLSPELVRGFDYAAAGDGTHFEISDENGTVLPYEIDTWNPGGESLLWVKAPYFLDGRKLTVVYGRTSEDMTARAAEVWSNYIGVWHLNAVGASGRYPNAAGDARFDGEVSSFSRTGQAGKFGQSVLIFTNASHNASSDERGGVFVLDGGALDLHANFTVSGWFYHTAVAGNGNEAFRWENIFCKRPHPVPTSAGMTSGFALRTGDNKADPNRLVVNASGGDQSVYISKLKNETWVHFALSFDGEGHPSAWLNGACMAELPAEAIEDNDEPLSIGNAGKGYLDAAGNRAWGGRADEVRLHAGAPSAAYLAAEYAAMANEHDYGQELCSLTIDRNEHFDDAVTIESDVAAVSNGVYRVGTRVTLTAVPDATGTFRKWYGDVPREGWTNATVSFVLERDAWVYARFVHPWTLAADKATMTDGHFTVNVAVLDEAARTLTVGKAAEAGLAATNDTGTGTIDLGGPIRLAGDNTPWRIDRFGGSRGSQSFPISRTNEVPFRYLSPGTVTTTTTWGTQLFHRGDTGNNAPPLFGAPYTMIVLDEPAGSSLLCNFMFSCQNDLTKLIVQAPNATDLFRVGDDNTVLARVFSTQSLAETRFDWWDLPSLFRIQHGFFVKHWGDDGSLRLRIPAGGAFSLPSMRGIDWLAETTYYNGGSPLFLMPNVEEISLGGATEGTTVTNLCTYAFAGDSSLRRLTLHAAPDIRIGRRIFASHTHSTFRTNEVIDGVTYSIGSNTSKGRVPDVIRFTGPAISETAIENLLDACPVVPTAAKPVVILASRYQDGWRENRRDWISDPTPAERAAYSGRMVLGVYRAGAEAPAGKAVVVHCQNDWDRTTKPLVLILR